MKKLWFTLVLALLGFGLWSLALRMLRSYPSPQRVAIAAMGRDLLSPVSSDFSKARYFVVVDLSSLKVRAIPNPYAGGRRPVGLRTGELLLDDQVGVVLARGIRPAASNCLRARGIRVYQSNPEATTAQQALQQYLSQQGPAALPAGLGPAAALPNLIATATVPRPLPDEYFLPELGLGLASRPGGSALVTRVLPNSRAALAGLQPGDVLVAVGAVSLAGPQDLRNRLAGGVQGQLATLTLLRQNVLFTTRM